MNPKKVLAVETDEEFVDLLLKGDERAPLKIGWRVEKIAGDPEDISPLGSHATVIGSVFHEDIGALYLVNWDHLPGAPVLVSGFKIKKLK